MSNPLLAAQAALRGVLLLALLAFIAGCAQTRPARPVVAAQPAVVLVSIDGFRADYLERGLTPTLQALADHGVRATSLRPSFPSLTFPNHYTLVTGLRPDRNGIVNNTMEDAAIPGQRFALSNRDAISDARWWDEATPLWTTLKRDGKRSATMFWPGSEAPIHGAHPDYWQAFDATITPDARVDTVLGWLDLPAAQRPAFITLYFDGVDHAGHRHGPDSAEVDDQLRIVDAALARLLGGLQQRGLRNDVNLVIVSDHGMAATSPQRVVFLDDLLPADSARVITYGILAGIRAEPGHVDAVERTLLAPHAHMQCWRKSELPARFHYGTNARIPPLLCLAANGWTLSNHAWFAKKKTFSLGEHGYDNDDPDMRALFIAHGPAFLRGKVVPEFDNVDVYPLLAHLLGIAPEVNDGNPAHARTLLAAPATR